jgi:hypothetical protein
MAVTNATARILGMKSGNQCAKPDCFRRLTEGATAFDPEVIIGQIAHIVAQADTGPRADPATPQDQRDAVENLILLCREHHAIADRQENTYTVADMRDWKREHEANVQRRMEESAGQVTFIELELVADAIIAAPVAETPGFNLTAVREKMDKNSLTDRISRDISIGMLGADVAKDYVAQRATMTPDFPDRLRGGFVAEYDRLFASGLRADDLFLALRSFAAGPSTDFVRQAAGLAVLVHLFRICEVFEP